ncbi:hypothetical protein KDU71_12025 [Carboxylicivirga sediminis]|uniref:Yip1 domain-containing protein n=1 Tax=Carboxylicivirga sediminis TaxID=2006564 RepID=A0A941F4J0_9BACT|nr:Yip1 family protein [Carboxylicivirga sediminis]MBR8536289.1 hypothetical protein [Carboxylicivirga sediminis]
MNKETISLGVLYNNLIGRLKGLVVSPQKEWSDIFSERKAINEVLAQFSFPLLGLYTLSTFIGYLLSHQGLDFGSAVKEAVFTFSSSFFGLYVSYFLLVKVGVLLGQEIGKEKAFQLIAYASAITYLTGSIIALVPETIVVASIVNLYIIYLVWLACRVLSTLSQDARIWLTIIASIFILAVPVLISRLFVFISNLTV